MDCGLVGNFVNPITVCMFLLMIIFNLECLLLIEENEMELTLLCEVAVNGCCGREW